VAHLRRKSGQRDQERALKLPTLGQSNSVWNGVLKDETARAALDQIKQAGFDIGHLRPRDPTFQSPSFADYVAAMPLLEDRPTRRDIHRHDSLRKHRPLVRALRNFARKCDDPFASVSLIKTRDRELQLGEDLGDLAARSASFVEKFLSWDWCVIEKNRRNALIAELRWTIRRRTGKPHDRELSTIIDAAYRAAGRTGPCLDNTTLDRIEKRVKETRVKAVGRLNFYAGVSSTPKNKSTRNPQKRR
jgi:hypothetical protein